MKTKLILLLLVSSVPAFATNPCTDFVKASCERMSLDKMIKDPSFKFSAFDPSGFATKTFESVTLEEARERKLAAPIEARFGKNGASLSVIVEQLENLKSSGSGVEISSLVKQILEGVGELKGKDVANLRSVRPLYGDYWQGYLNNAGITRAQESLFWKTAGPMITDLPTVKYFAEGIGPYCQVVSTSECFLRAREILSALYLGLWQPVEAELAKDEVYRSRVMNAIWSAEERKRLDHILAEIKTASIKIHGKVTSEQQARLDLVHLEFPDNSSIVGFKEWMTGQNGYDNRGTNNIEIFGHYAHAQEGDLVHLIAHEYGHQLIYILGDSTLLEKMRSTKEGNKLHFDIAEVLNLEYRPLAACLMSEKAAGIDHVRLNETLAVWYEAEIMAEYLKANSKDLSVEEKQRFAYYFNMSCEAGYHFDGVLGSKGPAHPSWNQRSNRILMAHPYFRDLFQCPQVSEPEHCVLK